MRGFTVRSGLHQERHLQFSNTTSKVKKTTGNRKRKQEYYEAKIKGETGTDLGGGGVTQPIM